jgi:hypothetical protein
MTPREEAIQRYLDMASSEDPLRRRIAAEQLKRLSSLTRHSATPPTTESPEVSVLELIEGVVGHLQVRPNGDREGPCPWHGSRSGRRLVVFAGGHRWWCRSCHRGGDAVAWTAQMEGIPYSAARRKLDQREVTRPRRRYEV